jgi:hypothetical protein
VTLVNLIEKRHREMIRRSLTLSVFFVPRHLPQNEIRTSWKMPHMHNKSTCQGIIKEIKRVLNDTKTLLNDRFAFLWILSLVKNH